MQFKKVLVANRGEIAVRVFRALREMRIASVAVHSNDDAQSLHVRQAGEAVALAQTGPAAYLDIEAVVAAALATGCDAIHPGYGFLSESAAFARRCGEVGIVLIGPGPDVLSLFGDKAAARRFARDQNVPIIEGVAESTDLAGVRAFRASLGEGASIMLKAISGGGGRGIRIVGPGEPVEEAFERCRSEALKAFGNDGLYVERYLPRVRHIEVQVVGDGHDVVHVWERECTLQRQQQKVIEIAPSPGLPAALRQRLLDDALKLARGAGYIGLGTVEFLVWADASAEDGLAYAFIEVNPRIQVEHTVTEELTGIDLVKAQVRIAAGARLADVGLATPPAARGHALQLRVNMEQQQSDGSVRPSAGTITALELPSGPGVRVDSFAYTGYRTNARFDSLLAKVIVHSTEPEFSVVLEKAADALREFRVKGVVTNADWLQALLQRPEIVEGRTHTRLVDEQAAALVAAAAALAPDPRPMAEGSAATVSAAADAVAEGLHAVHSPVHGAVASVAVEEGALVAAGTVLLVLEAMKMEHAIQAPIAGRVTNLRVAIGDGVTMEQVLLAIEPDDTASAGVSEMASGADTGRIRPELQDLIDRRQYSRDEARPDAIARRHERGLRSARENIDDLCDAGSFLEFGRLVVAAQRARRQFDDLMRSTPADGVVAGLGAVNGEIFGPTHSRCVVLAYDATVLAGTQGRESHRKVSRMLRTAEELKLPVVFYTEGGGGRPGDTEKPGDNTTFTQIAQLSGQVPLVGVLAGYCFAGNAAVLGCCDVIIATEGASLGMGGPAMVEGGGLGVFKPSEIGPAPMHFAKGVVDILVKDEAEATAMAKRYLAYFQGDVSPGHFHDQQLLRDALPKDRRRAYDVRSVIDLLADDGSVLELRAGFGRSMVTSLVRIEGRAVGVIANNPAHLGGAVDADAADKGARFLQLCDTFGLPVLQLCDTPGVMVGPQSETTALVRHSSRLLMAGANLRVPAFTIILRKAYGLGMVAMMGGALKTPLFNVAWPTGEYGAMGLEGAVRLGFRKELEAIADPAGRQAMFEQRVAGLYEEGRALNKASSFDFDDVIDPAESRDWIIGMIQASGSARRPPGSNPHAFVTPW